jgi:hypothetical protein
MTALFVALGTPAWADVRGVVAKPKPNVRLASAEFSVSNGNVVEAKATCKGNTRVFSGGYSSTSQHTNFVAVGTARSSNSFLAYAVQPPVNINAGVGRQTAEITVVALCAPAGEPVIFAGTP